MKFEFSNEKNKEVFRKKVLGWLKNDFEQKGKPQSHFWHNRAQIGYSLCLMSSLHSMLDYPNAGINKVKIDTKREGGVTITYYPDFAGIDLDTGAETGKIYIDKDTHKYKLFSYGRIYEGKLPDEIDLSQFNLNPEDPFLKEQVLSYTSKQEHTERSNGFNSCDGMLVLSDKDELIAYMIWTPLCKYVFSIDIVEVVEKHQNQGIFRKMITELSSKFTHVHLLRVSPIKESVEKFIHLGFEQDREDYFFFKKIREGLPSLDTLPDGHAIAVTSKNYYKIQRNPNDYPMKYFKITLDNHGNLETPIVTRHNREGYVGVYRNKKMVVEHKADYLFKNCTHFGFFLIIGKIKPYEPEKFINFFHENEIKSEQAPVPIKSEDSTHASSIKGAPEPTSKKQRTNYTPTIFSPPKQTEIKFEDCELPIKSLKN